MCLCFTNTSRRVASYCSNGKDHCIDGSIGVVMIIVCAWYTVYLEVKKGRVKPKKTI